MECDLFEITAHVSINRLLQQVRRVDVHAFHLLLCIPNQIEKGAEIEQVTSVGIETALFVTVHGDVTLATIDETGKDHMPTVVGGRERGGREGIRRGMLLLSR